jgi:hypothetical protein
MHGYTQEYLPGHAYIRVSITIDDKLDSQFRDAVYKLGVILRQSHLEEAIKIWLKQENGRKK